MIKYTTDDKVKIYKEINGGRIKMSIDILKAKKAFKDYIKGYNPEDPKIKIKITHIERVAQIAKKLAEDLKLSKEDVELAELIGLLHDIGRFEQIRVYNTFLDKDSINHAEYGVKVLFEDGLIRKFVEDDKYDEIIKIAILNHNKIKIEDGLSERELLHAKIIRDADKTDIYYVLTVGDKKDLWYTSDLSNEKFSDEVYEDFIKNRLISYSKVKTNLDLAAIDFSYLFDLYFSQSLKIIDENRYLEKFYNRFSFNDKQTEERFKKMYNITKEYVALQLKK